MKVEVPLGDNFHVSLLFFFILRHCHQKIHLQGAVDKKIVLATAYDMNAHCRKALTSHLEASEFRTIKIFPLQHVCLFSLSEAFAFFFGLVAAWVKSRAERPSVSGVNRQLHVQIGCKLGIRNRKDELTKQAKRNKLQIKKPEGN